MPRDAEPDATIDALKDMATAMIDWLAQLRAVRDPAERDALQEEFVAQVDGIRADILRRHGVSERQAAAIVARVLADVREIARAAPLGC